LLYCQRNGYLCSGYGKSWYRKFEQAAKWRICYL
jgi:hypothetical protein